MAINFIKKEDLSHITRTTRQWETTIDRYEIIPKGVLCIELCNDKLTKIKIGNGHLIYEQLPYVSDVNLSDYYTKEETNNLIKDLKAIKIKGEASSLSDLPLHGNEEGDLWFVSKSDPDEHSRYDEYVWYKNKWESFGSSDIDLSEYAKKSYVDTHIQEVQDEITEIIESGYLHKHNNKNILDQTSAVYTVEKDNKLRDLHNYDDTELREKAHTHLNKNILDQTDAVYNRDKDDKLSSLHNYDDTDVKDRISTLESVAHSHSNQDILDRTTAAFTKEQALQLLDCKDFEGTDGVHDGRHGFVPAPTAADAGKVLGANGQWVEGGGTGGDVVAQGGGIEITTDAQTGVKTVSVNAGAGLDIDQQTGELYVTSTGGDTIAEGSGIDITTDSQTGVKTISVDIGDGLQFNQNSEIDINTGDGLSINQDNELTVNTGEGLSINNNNAIELDKATTTTIGGVIVGDNLSIDNTGTLSADEYTPGEGISIDSNKEVSVKYNSDGLSINASDELELDKATKNSIGGVIVGDNIDVTNGTISVPIATDSSLGVVKPTNGLSIDNTGELSVNTGDGLSINQDNEIEINIGEGLSINQDNELEVSVGNGLSINASDEVELDKATASALGGVIVGDNIDVNNGTISVPKAASNKLGVVKPTDGLSVDSNGVLTVDTGDGLSIDSTTKEVNVNVGDGLQINQDNELEVSLGNGLQFDSNDDIEVNTGDGLSINQDNELEVNVGDGLSIDSTNNDINVKTGRALTINQDNEIDVNIASRSAYGVVKVGEGVNVDSNGIISVEAAPPFRTGDGIILTDESERLPSGFTKIEYVESSSTNVAYTSINYYVNANSKFIGRMSKTEPTTDSYGNSPGTVFGTIGSNYTRYMFGFVNDQGSSSPLYCGIQCGNSTSPDPWYNNKSSLITSFVLNDIVNFEASVAEGLKLNNELHQTYQVYGETLPFGRKLGVMAADANGISTGSAFYGRIYFLKIYEGNVLKVSLVPCIQTSSSTPGLYDTVAGTFYASTSGNPFLYDPETIDVEVPDWVLKADIATSSKLGSVKVGSGLSATNDGTLSVNTGDGLTVDGNNNLKAKIGAGLHFNENNAIEADEIDIDTYEPGNGISFIRHYARDLPVGYTQLEYIESRFDAGFILDYYPQKTSKIVCEAAFVDVNRSNPSDNCLFGSRNGNISSSKQFVFWFNNKTSDPYYVGFVYTGDTWSSVGEHYTYANMYQRLLFEISPSIGVYCNNVLIQNPLSYPDRDPSPYKLGILCLALSDTTIDTSRNYQSGRIYTFKIYESDTLVVDLVPCLNDSDVPGLYDMVSEVFYPSASGTDFSYDPDTFVTHDSITIDANRGAGIIYENNALALNPGSGLSIDANNDQKLNVNLADGLSIKNTSTNAIKINTGDGLSVDSTTNNLNVNIGDGLVKDSSNNIAINNNSDFYINTNNQFCINPLYAPTYEAGNGVQFVSTSPYNLPPNYTKLSCVESKNTSSDKSAFRLNYVPTTETKFDVLFGITKTSSDVTIIGSGGSNTAKYSLNITRSSAATNNTTVRFNYCQDSSSTSISFTTAIGDILHIVADKNGVYVNNNLVQTPIQTGSPSSYKLCVGSSPATNTAATFRDPSTPGKYYDIKIYEGSTLTVHLIPCLNDSNVPGMYDEVNELFYHNEWKTDFHYDENEKTRPGYYVQAKLGSGLQFDTNGAIEVVNGGTEYTAGDGIDIDANDEISVKIGNHLSFDQTTGNINVDDIIEYTAGDGISITLADDIDVFNNGDGWENLCYSDSTGNSTTDNYQWEIHSPISSSLTIPQGVTQIKAVAKDTNDNLIWTSFSWIDSNDYHFASTAPNDGHYDDWFDIPSGSVKVNFGVRWTRLSTSQAISTSDVDSVTVMFDNGDTKRIDVNVGDGLFIDSTNNDVNVKIGQALSINNSNEIDVNLGQALSINNDNEIDVDIATATSLGVVKAGSGLNIDEFGNLSTQATPFRIGRALSLDDESVRLPSAYAKAKYVANPSSAAVRISFRPSDYPNAKYTTSVSLDSCGSSSSYPTRYLCGASGWTGSLKIPLDGISGGLPIKTFFYIGNGNNPEYTSTAFQFGDRFDIEASVAGGYKINNEVVQASATPPSNFGTYYLAIFGSGASNGPGEPGFIGKMYYFRIYNSDDTLLCNLVPAVRRTDNVVGFYDMVGNQFYPSETSVAFTTDMDDLDVDDPDWVLNASIATSNFLGVVKPGTGLTVNEHGALSVNTGDGLTVNQNNELEVPVASTSTLGIVKIGHGVEIDPYGAIYVDAMVPFAAGVGLELIPGSSSVDALPEGYGKVDYIESNGSAYTIINYVPNRNTKVVGTSMMLNSTRDPVVFGARTGGTGQQFVFWFNTYSNTYAKVGFVYGTNTWSTSTDAADGRLVAYTVGTKFTYTISLEDELIIDDSFVHNITDNGTPPNMKLGIFTLTHTDTSIESNDNIFNGRMYDFKIYENNELVVNLVPAVRLEDDKVGFYDNIGNKFYTSLGSTQFTTDMSSMVIDYNETTMNVRLGEGLKTNSYNNITLDLHAGNGIDLAAYGSDLPSGYGELSYIEGNGNQWTQLDYYPTHDSRVVVDCISYETNSTDRALFGCREGTGGQPQFILWTGQKTSGYVTASFVYGSNVWDDDNNTGVAVGERFIVDASYNGVYINGDLFESITDQGNVPAYKVALFTVANGDGTYITDKGMGKYRIYSFKIYEGNDLVVDLRPALSPIHIPGFYDVVNDVFYSSLTNTAFVYDSGSVVYPSGLQLTTKIGSGLQYDSNGAIEAIPAGLTPATASTLGGVIVGNGLTVTSDGTISTVTGKAYIAGEGINMSSSQYEFSAENEQYLFRYQVTCELHGSFNREFQKYSDDTALGMVWNVYNSGTLWSGPLFVGLSADAVKYTTNNTTYSALGTFSYLGKTWYYSDTQMYVSNIDGTDYDGNMVVDTETYASTSDIVQACKSLIDRARVILKVDEISLLPATEDTLGGIKIGEGLSIDENNVVSSTVYEEGQGIIFETSGSTDSFDVKNKEYYFTDEARCQITGNFGPRAYWRVYTDDPCLAVIFYRSDSTTAPLYIGLTENSVKMYQSWDGNVLGPDGTFDYKGYSWYYTFNYGLYYSSGVDQLGHLQTVSGTSSDDLVNVAKHVIDLAELINPGIKTYDVWGDGTGWLNGAYNDSQSDQFWTNWYYTYHSNQNEYLEVPTGAIKMRLIGISNENDSRFQGGGVDCFNSSHHHFASVGCITDEWVDIPLGTVYLQFGVKWNELNDRTISSSDIKSVTLEIKVPKNNAITAKLGDGLTFDENDAITLDESIKLIIHCVGDPLT